jgi:hypothetical protein
MNRLLLDELQAMRCYPSVTVLMNTTPGNGWSSDELASARRLLQKADERLTTDVDDSTRTALIESLERLVAEQSQEISHTAVALCVSPEHAAAVSLGSAVDERVVVDETFATRDLVADLNAAATYRVLTVSETTARAFLGDRNRLVELHRDGWPLTRADETGSTVWNQQVNAAARDLHARRPLPTVVAGVQRSVARIVDDRSLDVIAQVTGNHDRTSPAQLHTLVWPTVVDWMDATRQRCLDRLDSARSARRYASGVDEIWPLAHEGRVELLVVEDDFALSARVDDSGHLEPTDDEQRDVVHDVVDEIIEAVLQRRGEAAMVGPSMLAGQGRIAAVLRY